MMEEKYRRLSNSIPPLHPNPSKDHIRAKNIRFMERTLLLRNQSPHMFDLTQLNGLSFGKKSELFFFKRMLEGWNREREEGKKPFSTLEYELNCFIFNHLKLLAIQMQPTRTENLHKLYEWYGATKTKQPAWYEKVDILMKKRNNKINSALEESMIRATFHSSLPAQQANHFYKKYITSIPENGEERHRKLLTLPDADTYNFGKETQSSIDPVHRLVKLCDERLIEYELTKKVKSKQSGTGQKLKPLVLNKMHGSKSTSKILDTTNANSFSRTFNNQSQVSFAKDETKSGESTFLTNSNLDMSIRLGVNDLGLPKITKNLVLNKQNIIKTSSFRRSEFVEGNHEEQQPRLNSSTLLRKLEPIQGLTLLSNPNIQVTKKKKA